jgi:hypothetical protein
MVCYNDVVSSFLVVCHLFVIMHVRDFLLHFPRLRNINKIVNLTGNYLKFKLVSLKYAIITSEMENVLKLV